MLYRIKGQHTLKVERFSQQNVKHALIFWHCRKVRVEVRKTRIIRLCEQRVSSTSIATPCVAFIYQRCSCEISLKWGNRDWQKLGDDRRQSKRKSLVVGPVSDFEALGSIAGLCGVLYLWRSDPGRRETLQWATQQSMNCHAGESLSSIHWNDLCQGLRPGERCGRARLLRVIQHIKQQWMEQVL